MIYNSPILRLELLYGPGAWIAMAHCRHSLSWRVDLALSARLRLRINQGALLLGQRSGWRRLVSCDASSKRPRHSQADRRVSSKMLRYALLRLNTNPLPLPAARSLLCCIRDVCNPSLQLANNQGQLSAVAFPLRSIPRSRYEAGAAGLELALARAS